MKISTMSIRRLTDEEIIQELKEESKGKEEQEFSEVSLCHPGNYLYNIGDKIFFEPLTFSEDDWAQKDNIKYPYYVVMPFI